MYASGQQEPMTRHPAFFEGSEMPTAGWWPALWPDPAGVLKSVGLERNMDAIDLCCGDGWFTPDIARTAHQVLAIDVERDLLNVARHRVAEAGLTNCAFVVGDAYDVAALARRPVDAVFMANAYHGVHDRDRLVRSVRDALKPGGRFIVVNWHRRPREETIVSGEPRGPRTELRMSPQQTIRSIEAGGLTYVKAVELPPYHYAVIFERTQSDEPDAPNPRP
jgi:SAM-dependent methyltransferase